MTAVSCRRWYYRSQTCDRWSSLLTYSPFAYTVSCTDRAPAARPSTTSVACRRALSS